MKEQSGTGQFRSRRTSHSKDRKVYLRTGSRAGLLPRGLLAVCRRFLLLTELKLSNYRGIDALALPGILLNCLALFEGHLGSLVLQIVELPCSDLLHPSIGLKSV